MNAHWPGVGTQATVCGLPSPAFVSVRWARHASLVTCARCRQAMGTRWVCYCEEARPGCGPHRDWCPEPPTRLHVASGNRFCQACADARQLVTRPMDDG